MTCYKKGGGHTGEYEIGRELHSLNNLITRYIDRDSHKAQIDSVTGTNGWIISYLGNNEGREIYQKDLEKHFTITRSTVSKVLILMEQKGLIERTSVAHDSRLKKLTLTPKAQELLKLMREDIMRLEQTLTAGFSESELDTLLSYIRRMKANIE